jgi:hypothetical protein
MTLNTILFADADIARCSRMRVRIQLCSSAQGSSYNQHKLQQHGTPGGPRATSGARSLVTRPEGFLGPWVQRVNHSWLKRRKLWTVLGNSIHTVYEFAWILREGGGTEFNRQLNLGIQYNRIRGEFKKWRQYWDIFVVWMATLLRPGHTVAQGQTVTCCECGSAVVRVC